MFLVGLTACFLGSCTQYYPGIHRSITSVDVNIGHRTPRGIRVDLGAEDIGLLSRIDAETNALEQCLGVEIRRNAFVVVFPATYASSCTGALLFPCATNPGICQAKIDAGQFTLLPDSPCAAEELPCIECPCDCRAVIQHGLYILTNRTMELYKAVLASLVMGVINPWSDPKIRECIGAGG